MHHCKNALIQGIVAETKGDTTAANDIYAQVVSQIGGTIGVDSISDVAGASAANSKNIFFNFANESKSW